MTGAVRLGDICTGHGCWPGRPNITASQTVFVNDRGAHRVNDQWASHCCCSIPESHGSAQATGSPTVFVEGRAKARIGDGVACGSRNLTGSGNVIVDELGCTPPER